MGQLDGKVALVTGAGDGIGAGIARVFAAEGARVVVAEINPDTGRAVADSLGDAGHFVACDVADKSQVESAVTSAVDHFGTLDVLVNNAWGGGRISRVEHKTPELVQGGLDIGFLGPLWAMNAAHTVMKPKGWGRIINMASLNGVNAHMGTLEYNSAKEALRAASRTAAREWASTGITVNVICPAAKSASFRRVMQQNPELEAAADAGNPMGRMGDPDGDIAPVAVFLASDASRYLTGNTLFVDGGGHINGSSWAPDLGD
ncbi:MAG TPA: oxidoreductase [Acidimicrobiaceae bacterium]|nr:oxidoreductase [Acidimicrobiaceae bacterium]HCH80679.1 oxidoreductase [Acidimicrobiaceae bacterium]